MLEKINIQEKMAELDGPWKPIDIVNINDQVIRLALFKGEYHWHKHEREDELFLVYKGKITIEVKNKEEISLQEGECIVIPKGMEHKPKSEGKSYVLLFEPKKLKSKGD
ncbi:MAG: cupin domain-containing protein [Candidatus Thorarchaeota archaeon]